MDIILYIVDEGSACCKKIEKVEKKTATGTATRKARTNRKKQAAHFFF